VARTANSDPKRHTAFEPLYDIDTQTGASVEIFYADRTLAASFGACEGWFWWTCEPGLVPGDPPTGPFASGFAAYRNFATRAKCLLSALSAPTAHFGGWPVPASRQGPDKPDKGHAS
jgi:hypothetical protein